MQTISISRQNGRKLGANEGESVWHLSDKFKCNEFITAFNKMVTSLENAFPTSGRETLCDSELSAIGLHGTLVILEAIDPDRDIQLENAVRRRK